MMCFMEPSSKLRFHYECSTLYGKKRARLCPEPYTGEMVEVTGERRCPMPQPSTDRPNRTYSAGYALLQSQEPLPPYELDPTFDTPIVHRRIGDVIAKAVEKRIRKR
jgi:hypothetical protein